MYRTDDKQISVLISRVRQAHQCWSLLSFHNYFYKMSDLLGYSKPLTPNKPLQPSYLLHPSLPQPVLSGTGPLIEFSVQVTKCILRRQLNWFWWQYSWTRWRICIENDVHLHTPNQVRAYFHDWSRQKG